VSEYDALVELVQRATLEQLLTSEAYGFGLTTATPVQRAICRAADGQPLGALWLDADVRAAFGAEPTERPKEVLLLSGIRTAKSLMAAAVAVHASQHCDLSGLGPGEVPRFPIVSVSLDLAQVIFGHLTGQTTANPVLRCLQMAPPTADTVTLRHPSGRPVEIKVVAGSRAGASLAARWLVGVAFDEAPKMSGEESVVNLKDARANVVGRLRPGAQIWCIGSPWAPFGPVYELQKEHFGKPSARIVVVRTPAPTMNPHWWTPERCADLKATDPNAYETDVLANFRAPEESLFTSAELDRVTRVGPDVLEPDDSHSYGAAMDPATRGNAWTLAVTTREGAVRRVALTSQWVGTTAHPLDPRAVLKEIAEVCSKYRISVLYTDQWSADALRALARDEGLELVPINWSEKEKLDRYQTFKASVQTSLVELGPSAEVRADLQRVVRKTTQTGISIVLPRTSDGRHCDYAPAIVLACEPYLNDVIHEPTSAEAMREEEAEMRRSALQSLDPAPRGWADPR